MVRNCWESLICAQHNNKDKRPLVGAHWRWGRLQWILLSSNLGENGSMTGSSCLHTNNIKHLLKIFWWEIYLSFNLNIGIKKSSVSKDTIHPFSSTKEQNALVCGQIYVGVGLTELLVSSQLSRVPRLHKLNGPTPCTGTPAPFSPLRIKLTRLGWHESSIKSKSSIIKKRKKL